LKDFECVYSYTNTNDIPRISLDCEVYITGNNSNDTNQYESEDVRVKCDNFQHIDIKGVPRSTPHLYSCA
jgi:hypothetical protein